MILKKLSFLVMAFVAAPLAAGDWFDMQNCGICKPMGEQMHIMSEITWETVELPNGILTVTVVPAKHKEAMEQAHSDMEAAIKRLEGGEQMDLCGHCQSYGALLQAGAHKQELEADACSITVLTSDDPEVVKKIHEHSKRSEEEFAKMTPQLQHSS